MTPTVDSLAHFTENAADLVDHVKESGMPLMLPVDSKAIDETIAQPDPTDGDE